MTIMPHDLLHNFYTELSSNFSTAASDAFECVIALHPTHPIYKGHFEQLPVAPGVCLIYIIQELLMKKLNKALRMAAGANIKFLAIVNPLEVQRLIISFDLSRQGEALDVQASYRSEAGLCYMKFKGVFQSDE